MTISELTKKVISFVPIGITVSDNFFNIQYNLFGLEIFSIILVDEKNYIAI